MANYLTTDTDLTSVANAIRTKGGTSASLAFPAGFVSAVEAIPTGGGGFLTDALISGVYNGEAITSNLTTLSRVFCYTTGAFSVRMPNLLDSNSANVMDSSSITSFFAPLASFRGRQAFIRCSSLETLVIKYFSNYGNCENDTSLKSVDLSESGGYLDGTFKNCSLFTTFIIRGDGVLTLKNLTAFTDTPFDSGGTGGTLYVPSALISSYQSASNWSTILGYANNSIQAIEGSQYENYYADGTPIT